jgi:polyisoprenoid-binding protein YceI
MRIALCLSVVCCFLTAGCDNKTGSVSKSSDTKSPDTNTWTAVPRKQKASDDKQPQSESNGPSLTDPTSSTASDTKVAAAIDSGTVKLSPANAKIEFVGKHADSSKPDRIGGFERFTGQAAVDTDKKTLRAIELDIETGSLWTQFPGLTTHLNSPDFFDTREHPTAKFKSTRIEADDATGQQKITGQFTLMGTTKEITIPAKVQIGDDGLSLNAGFTIDRAEYGMDKLQDDVRKDVDLKVVVGEKTEPQKVVQDSAPNRGGAASP